MQAYASSTDLAARHDIDVIGDLASDERARMSRLDILNDPNVMVALQDASGAVETALMRGGNYRPEDLATLQGPQLAHLKRIVCYIAMAVLFERRPGVHEDIAETYTERATNYLLALQRGENVFGLDDDRLKKGQPTVGGMTAIGYSRNNLIPERMERFFPLTQSRLPRDR